MLVTLIAGSEIEKRVSFFELSTHILFKLKPETESNASKLSAP